MDMNGDARKLMTIFESIVERDMMGEHVYEKTSVAKDAGMMADDVVTEDGSGHDEQVDDMDEEHEGLYDSAMRLWDIMDENHSLDIMEELLILLFGVETSKLEKERAGFATDGTGWRK